MKLSLVVVFALIMHVLDATNPESELMIQKRIKESAIAFFEKDEVIEFTVKADFGAIRADRERIKNDYHPAELLWNDRGDTISIAFKLKTRGNFRLKCENCDFPPLRFNFKTKHVVNTVFEGQDKLKLVTHCRDTSVLMQQAMLREYLVYKMYNVVSDTSLRVRLVRVNYVDVVTGDELKKYAFFIESKSQMAERLGVEEVEMVNLMKSQLYENNMLQLALFNYMIGNTDWSIPKLHNVAILRAERHAPPIAVPYDFDMSEFVDACYMKVYMGRELLENRYKGIKVPMESLESAIGHYQSKKIALTNVILNCPYLDIETKQECIKIINSFYEVLSDKQAYRRAFITDANK